MMLAEGFGREHRRFLKLLPLQMKALGDLVQLLLLLVPEI